MADLAATFAHALSRELNSRIMPAAVPPETFAACPLPADVEIIDVATGQLLPKGTKLDLPNRVVLGHWSISIPSGRITETEVRFPAFVPRLVGFGRRGGEKRNIAGGAYEENVYGAQPERKFPVQDEHLVQLDNFGNVLINGRIYVLRRNQPYPLHTYPLMDAFINDWWITLGYGAYRGDLHSTNQDERTKIVNAIVQWANSLDTHLQPFERLLPTQTALVISAGDHDPATAVTSAKVHATLRQQLMESVQENVALRQACGVLTERLNMVPTHLEEIARQATAAIAPELESCAQAQAALGAQVSTWSERAQALRESLGTVDHESVQRAQDAAADAQRRRRAKAPGQS